MARFNCTITEEKNEVRWTISGDIDEKAIFPMANPTKKLTVNLKNVTVLNSFGIKLWGQWMKNDIQPVSISLEQCPYVIIRNLGMIQGFINDKTTVTSFFVPFINESGTEEKQVLMTLGEDFYHDGSYTVPTVQDSSGNAMEIDASSNYFSFLKKKK